jgi:hypothetical protein
VLEVLLCQPRGSVPDNARTTLPQGRCTIPSPVHGAAGEALRAQVRGPGGNQPARGRIGYHDVFNAGTGRAKSRVVTRCKSAVTGQDVGRWRSIRS